jgi:hypothetical protein
MSLCNSADKLKDVRGKGTKRAIQSSLVTRKVLPLTESNLLLFKMANDTMSTAQRVSLWVAAMPSTFEHFEVFDLPCNDRGRLVCCLKVEIKSGKYKMLPVYQVLMVK